MKRWLTLFLAATMLFSLTACSNNPQQEKEPTLYEQVMALIEAGDGDGAYALLADVEDTEENKDLIDLRNHFYMVPVECVNINSSQIATTTTYTYDTQGNLLSEVSVSGGNRYEKNYADYQNGLPMSGSGINVINGAYTSTYTYDENGNPLRTETKYDSGQETTIVYTYDINGILRRKDTSSKNSLGQSAPSYVIYNENGRVLTDYQSQFSGAWTSVSNTYDTDGNKLKEEHLSTMLNNNHTSTYTYDKYGNRLSFTWYIYTTTHKYTYEYTYDKNGNVLTKKEYYAGKLNDTTTYTYDEKGRVLSEKSKDSDSKTTYTITYDANGNRLTWNSTYSSDATTYTESCTYVYDENGNCVTEKYSRDNGNWTTKNYDSYGNLLKSENKNGESVTFTWKRCYYPNGIPDNVKDCFENYRYSAPIFTSDY